MNNNKYDFDYIKQNTSIREVLGYYGIEIGQVKKVMIYCPFHEDRSPSMSIDTEKNLFYCHGCNAKGSVIDLVMQMEGLNFPEACKIMGDRYNANMSIGQFVRKKPIEKRKPKKRYLVSDKASEIYNKLNEITSLTDQGYRYLTKERGFSEATIERYGIHSLDDGNTIYRALRGLYSKDELREAGLLNSRGGFIFNNAGILIPFRMNDEIVYYGYRNYNIGQDRKYICLKDKAKHYFVGDIDQKQAYVFEGVLDAMSFYQLFGSGNIIACGGVGGADNDKILSYLGQFDCRTDLRFIYLLDNDKAGQDKVKELQEKGDKAYILSDWVKETKCCLEVSGMKDWNEVLVKGGGIENVKCKM